MPQIIKLNKYGTLAISIPKAIVDMTKLKQGDVLDLEMKSIDPLIIALKKRKPIEW